MRWFDSDFDYVQELIDTWNNRRKQVRTAYFILAALLILAGILTAVFPVSIFAVIQYLYVYLFDRDRHLPLYCLLVHDLLF